jgi:hypothetical protein
VSETVTVQARHPRVFLTSVLRELKPLESCRTVWPSGFESDVFDFGRSSVSVYFPMRLNLQFFKGDVIKLGFRFGNNETFYSDTRVVRAETRLLSVELLRVSPSQYKMIDQFLSNTFIAKHMQEVHQQNFAPEQTFNKWFHGPLDTNLYLWTDGTTATRLCLELRDRIYVWDAHGWMIGSSRDTLSYSTEDYTYYANFLAELSDIKSASEIQSAIDFLEAANLPIWNKIKTIVKGS